MYKDRTNWFNYTDGKSNLIINGAYSIYYRRWLENFDATQILPVDGTDMLQNPAKWTLAVQVIRLLTRHIILIYKKEKITNFKLVNYIAPSADFLTPGRVEYCYGLRITTPSSI